MSTTQSLVCVCLDSASALLFILMERVIHLSKALSQEQRTPSTQIVKIYEQSSSELLSFLQNVGGPTTDYKARLERMIGKLNDLTGVKQVVVLTIPSKYTTSDWGALYWTFLHAVSILIEYFMEIGSLLDTLDLPLLVYNIDAILFCGECRHHYTIIKNTEPIKNCIKRIAFGFTIGGLTDFHNIITDNIYKTSRKLQKTPRAFSIVDMAITWGAIENDLNIETISTTNEYLKPHVDWQTNTHIALSILCAVRLEQTYVVSSQYLKRRIYDESTSAEDIDKIFFDIVSLKPEVIDKVSAPNRDFVFRAVGYLYSEYYEEILKPVFDSRVTNTKQLEAINTLVSKAIKAKK